MTAARSSSSFSDLRSASALNAPPAGPNDTLYENVWPAVIAVPPLTGLATVQATWRLSPTRIVTESPVATAVPPVNGPSPVPVSVGPWNTVTRTVRASLSATQIATTPGSTRRTIGPASTSGHCSTPMRPEALPRRHGPVDDDGSVTADRI